MYGPSSRSWEVDWRSNGRVKNETTTRQCEKRKGTGSHAENADSPKEKNPVSFPWFPWSNSKVTEISVLSLVRNLLCVCVCGQLLQGSLESGAFVTSPSAPGHTEY